MKYNLMSFLAVVAGALIGGLVNSGIISIGPLVIPPPEGADFSTQESLAASMPLLSAQHFIFPFLAHALGTLVGCIVAVRIGKGHPLRLALPVSLLFFIGGAWMVNQLPSPLWFNIADLSLAYFPMAWLAARIASRKR